MNSLFNSLTLIGDNHFGKTSSFLKNFTLIIPKSKAKHFQIMNEVKVPQSFTNK
jgi:predicted ATP-dependent endonuclease of OLD family